MARTPQYALQLGAKIDELKAYFEKELSSMNIRLDGLAKTVKGHDEDLRGNGELGLKARVKIVETYLVSIKRLSWLILTLIIAQFAARIFNII